MLIMATIIFAIITGYIILNYKNKYAYVIGIYFYSVVLLLFTAILYVSRLSMFPFLSTLERNFYGIFAALHLPFGIIVWLSNLGVALFLLSSVLFVRFFLRSKWRYVLLLIIPILSFLYWNSPEHCWSLFLQSNTNLTLNQVNVVNTKIKSEKIISILIFIIYTLIPFVCLIINFFKTKIPLMKKYAVVYFCCIFTIDVYIYYFFIYGVYSSVMFFRVDLLKFPQGLINVDSAKYTAPFTFFASLIIVLCLMILYRPFNTFTVILRREMIRNTRSLNQNLRMLLHTYKNSFLGIEKLCQMSKIYLTDGENEKAMDKVKEIQWVSNDSMDRIARMLDLLRDVAVRYQQVNVKECFERALKQVSLPEGIQIERICSDDNSYILGDAVHLQEVFVNLLENSAEAMKNIKDRTPRIQFRIISERNMVYISLTDNGRGMNRKEQKKIFYMFYSSKPSSMCGGIGLNYVKKVITQLNGEITVKSVKNEFTRFDIYLSSYRKKGEYLWKRKQNN